MASRPRRRDIKAILADPERRRRLMVATIQATQAREGIDTTPEQAERAYRIVTERERVACFKLEPFRGPPDERQARFVEALSDGAGVRFDVARRDFEAIEGVPLAYEELQVTAEAFRKFPALEPAHARARRGAYTGDDERYVRQWWEIADRKVGRFTWEPFAKGGEFARFYADVHLLVHWDPARQTFANYEGRKGRETARPESLDDFFKPGLTWPRRTQRGFNIRLLREGCVFSDKGPTVFPNHLGQAGFLLGVLNSTLCEYTLRALTSFGSWEVGAVKRIPIPEPEPDLGRAIGELAIALHDLKQRWDQGNETSTAFTVPWSLDKEWTGDARSLPERLDAVLVAEREREAELRAGYAELNDLVFALYRIGGDARRAIEESRASAASEVLWPEMERRSPEQKRMEHVYRLLSHAVRRVVDADTDGIVPLPPCAGEASLLERVLAELADLFPGYDQLETDLANELSRGAKDYRRVRGGIEGWLDDVFFAYHTSLYRGRPVLWHIASAKGTARAAFGALVHYHRFDRDRMAKVRAVYVRDAIATCRREAALAGQENRAEARLDWQAREEEIERLDERLAAVQEGAVEGPEGGPGDLRILTPWKQPDERPRGWDPDLDDGVNVNIAPLEKAGVLRSGLD